MSWLVIPGFCGDWGAWPDLFLLAGNFAGVHPLAVTLPVCARYSLQMLVRYRYTPVSGHEMVWCGECTPYTDLPLGNFLQRTAGRLPDSAGARCRASSVLNGLERA